MRNRFFVPHVVVHHTRRVPQPILPISYRFFLVVALPQGIAHLSLLQQLSLAKSATMRRRAYGFPGPFGTIVAFEYRVSERYSIYLDPEGRFP
jgi:hypothetical protein